MHRNATSGGACKATRAKKTLIQKREQLLSHNQLFRYLKINQPPLFTLLCESIKFLCILTNPHSYILYGDLLVLVFHWKKHRKL